MKHHLVATLLASTLLACLGVATANTPPAPAASTAAPAVPSKPVVDDRPAPDATTERVLTAMNNASTWGHPDLFGEFTGMRLYSEGHYQAAIKYFKYGARYADKLSQLSIGLMYANGQGVDKDPVTACAWLAMAAERKYPAFVATRDRVCEALTPAQHDQAVAVLDKLMPEYGDKVAKLRMTKALRLAKMQTTGSRLGFDSGITTANTRPDCGGPTVASGGINAPVAGCSSSDFWSPWRWDPKKYFTTRDAQWRGTVTVGSMEEVGKSVNGAKPANKPTSLPPASASSTGH